MVGGVGEDGQDEFFGDDGEEEDIVEGGDDFGDEGGLVDVFGVWVFEFIVECWVEEVVEVVGLGKVGRVCDVVYGGGEFVGEVFVENFEFVVVVDIVVIVVLELFFFLCFYYRSVVV